MSLLRARRAQERRISDPYGARIPGPGEHGGTRHRHAYVSYDQGLRHSAVWACVDLRAGVMSSFPADVVRTRGGEHEQVDAPPFIQMPAYRTPWSSWIYQVISSLDLRGNFYGLITDFDRMGKPLKIEPLFPDAVSARYLTRSSMEWRVDGKLVPEEQIFHIAYRRLASGSPFGLSPISYAAANPVELGISAEQFGLDFFRDGAHPTSILSTDAEVNDEEARIVQARYLANIDGRKPVVLGYGLKAQQIQIAPEESQFLETISANDAVIARIFGVPGDMIDAMSPHRGSVTYSNREGRAIDWLAFRIRPLIKCIQDHISPLLVNGQDLRLNVASLIQADALTQAQMMQIQVQSHLLTADEGRHILDRPPMDDGVGKEPYPWPGAAVPTVAPGTTPPPTPADPSTGPSAA